MLKFSLVDYLKKKVFKVSKRRIIIIIVKEVEKKKKLYFKKKFLNFLKKKFL